MTFKVPDMSCEHCVKRISAAVKALKNVDRVDIDLNSKKVVVQGSASGEDIMKAIRSAGYSPEASE